MFNLGIQKNTTEYKNEDYEIKYLADLEENEELTGEIHISDLRSGEYQGKKVHQFYIILTNHQKKLKWICGISTSVYKQKNTENEMIYGKQGGRLYTLIDTLNHIINKTPLDTLKSYTILFNTFQENINEKIETATLKAIKSKHPNAKTSNLKFTQITPI